jgi:hypothetical protein
MSLMADMENQGNSRKYLMSRIADAVPVFISAELLNVEDLGVQRLYIQLY